MIACRSITPMMALAAVIGAAEVPGRQAETPPTPKVIWQFEAGG